MFAIFHCIAKRASTIRRIHAAGTALLARPGCPTLTACGSLKRPLPGPFDGLTRSELGRIEPLPLARWCDRLRRLGDEVELTPAVGVAPWPALRLYSGKLGYQ